MLDYQFFGPNALGHHLTSLFFHVANALLLFLVLKRVTGEVWPSAFVAAAFALHPLHVESVAWVSERKDILSGFFWMLTMVAYVRYAEQPGMRRYLLVILALCLGLLSKPMLVTLPFVLLLLDYWPLGRFQLSQPTNTRHALRQDEAPLKPAKGGYQRVPTWCLVVISSIITFIVQRSAKAVAPSEMIPLKFRISNALLSYISYVGKMVYPSHLAALYPIHRIPSWQPIICFMVLTFILIVIIASRRPYLMVGWLWYLVTLVPVIGIVQVGSQAMADRYTYLPSIGIFIMVAWGAAEVIAKWRFHKLWVGTSTGLVLAVLLVCTRVQVQYWQDSFTIYKRTVEVTENNFKMHTLYGSALYYRGEIDKAVAQFREALRIKPQYSKANNGLGKALFEQGNFNEAVKCFNAALSTAKESFVENDLPDLYGNLGKAYMQLDKDDLAITSLIKSIELDPNSASNLNNVAWVLATAKNTKLQNPTDAVKYAQKACELAVPAEQPAFLDTLAVAYAAAGEFPEAVKTAEKAIKLANDAGKKDLAEEIQKRLELYRAGQPYYQK
jgi:tetratricopeptide (TPR) repeat protein